MYRFDCLLMAQSEHIEGDLKIRVDVGVPYIPVFKPLLYSHPDTHLELLGEYQCLPS